MRSFRFNYVAKVMLFFEIQTKVGVFFAKCSKITVSALGRLPIPVGGPMRQSLQ